MCDSLKITNCCLKFDSPESHLLINYTEIIIHIIESLMPTFSIKSNILTASDSFTKTLLALTLTSKLTHSVSVRLLYSHCLYINTYPRITQFLETLEPPRLPENRNSPPWKAQLRQRPNESQLRRLKFCTTLYLGFTDTVSVLRIPNICALLDLLAPTLKHLTLSIPMLGALRHLRCDRERGPHPQRFGTKPPPRILKSLSNLTSLEEFRSHTGDGWIFNSAESETIYCSPPIDMNAFWPRLRVLEMRELGNMRLIYTQSRGISPKLEHLKQPPSEIDKSFASARSAKVYRLS